MLLVLERQLSSRIQQQVTRKLHVNRPSRLQSSRQLANAFGRRYASDVSSFSGTESKSTLTVSNERLPQAPTPSSSTSHDTAGSATEHRPTSTSTSTSSIDPVIPPDASSRLSTLSASLPTRSVRRKFATYLSLSKPRLSFMIVLTAAAAYSLYPVPAVLLPSSTASPSLSTLTLLFLTSGTFLTSACANTFNMLYEPKFDAMMSRTRNRPLVRKLLTTRAAFGFAFATGASGLIALYFGVNPTVAGLAAINIFLYAGVYTPMKRVSVVNTWIGAVVGAIPPLMGWAAAAGQVASSGDWEELLLGPESAGGWLLAALLYAWQFPHFNALSWTIREEYKYAGYRMLAWVNPAMNSRVALRYSILFFPICIGLSYAGVTDNAFLVTSSIANTWLLKQAWAFYKKQGHGGSARGLFWAGVWHLPVLMVLAMAHKKGLWDGTARWFVGEHEEDEVSALD
jgi:protoheme IX farnesyltransferase